MGSVISAIGGAIMSVISAIASVFMAIVGGITTVLVSIWNFILDVICCRCGSRRRTRTSGGYGRRRGGVATY